MEARILIVDDDTAHRQMLNAVLGEEGYQIAEAPDGESAVAAVQEQFYDLVLMDIRMKALSGIEAQKRIAAISPGIPVIIMTAYASVDTAREALKSGAFDYLTKPLDIDELKILVRRALEHQRLKQDNVRLRQRLAEHFDTGRMVAASRPMIALLEKVAMVAPSEATVLITGESGTGKELIAEAIHQNSPRRERPMVKVNCAALPDTLLESELFGHEKGAFTGALQSRQGRFQMADRSSIFLDEIGEMAPATQAKILRALQEGEIEPLGSSRTIRVDVRVIAATNKNLAEEIADGHFRQDLYYRLNVMHLAVPPLRERREDIPLLADFFLKKYAEKNRVVIKGFTPRAMDILMRHEWPGNVRELENLVERAVILARGDVVTPDEFPAALAGVESAVPEDHAAAPTARTIKDMEREMIVRTLEETGGNRTRTAEILGISRRTLQLKLKAYGINP